MKKFLSMLLSVLLFFSALGAGTVVFAADECSCGVTPIVYVKGRTNIYKDKNDLSKGLAEKNVSGGKESIKEAAINISSAFAKAMLTDKWDEYCDVLYEEIAPLYDQYPCDENGEVSNNSGIAPYWSIEESVKRIIERGRNFHIYAKADITLYQFQYDMRLDPIKNAADLKLFIETVKKVSGHKKVSIVSRCEGTVIANALFNAYGWDDIESVVMYNPIAAGAEIADSVFGNTVKFDSAGISRMAFEFLGNDPVMDLIRSGLELSEYGGVLGSISDFVQKIYDKVAPNVMPRLIRATFGQCPGWYGMVSPEVFEDCKNFTLGGNPDGKYDGLIEKIDNYNYGYKLKARSVLEEMKKDGVKVYVIAKYNNQMYPVMEVSDRLGDGVVSVLKQTYNGSTCADITNTLSDEYLASANMKYVSPDKMIDSSTAAFPEHTWYIRDLQHDYYPPSFDPYIFKLVRYDGYADIDTFSDMPQYLRYVGVKENDNNHIEILTKESPLPTDNQPKKSIVTILMDFIIRMLNFIKYQFDKVKK